VTAVESLLPIVTAWLPTQLSDESPAPQKDDEG